MLKYWLVCLSAYMLAGSILKGQINKPALLPLPQALQWTDEQFVLSSCKAIVVKGARLQKEARWLQSYLGGKIPITRNKTKQPYIELTLANVLLKEEAYQLQVTNHRIQIVANTPHGIYNALQTLQQLTIDKHQIAGCVIIDHPANAWRGYMVDVGRNFQSLSLLKQQIDQMAYYKLNVFHFHCTEDIAWRLQIKQYPQLTDSSNMIRNKGRFYNVNEMKELIQYCRDRYITLVPEIDMPGHSAAFTRAMGVDMQSAEGLHIVKNILREICTTYDVPYIHIGADEVKIKNKQFLPEVTALLKSYRKQIIGWSPGGNYDNSVIRQLWKDVSDTTTPHIDSRSLYISDMDPLNCVVSLFQRRFSVNKNLLGAEFCLWGDRRVATEEDLISTNPVYSRHACLCRT